MAFKIIHQYQIYIEGLANNNSEVIARIYKKFAPKVTYYIKMNSGSEDEAQDVIQEVLIAMYNQAKTKGLELTCPFDAYFFLLCKRRWLNELKKSSKSIVELLYKSKVINEDQTLNEEKVNLLVEKYGTEFPLQAKEIKEITTTTSRCC